MCLKILLRCVIQDWKCFKRVVERVWHCCAAANRRCSKVMFPSHWLPFVSFNFPTTARVSVLSKPDSAGDYKNQSPFYYVESDHWKPPPIPGRIQTRPELSFPPVIRRRWRGPQTFLCSQTHPPDEHCQRQALCLVASFLVCRSLQEWCAGSLPTPWTGHHSSWDCSPYWSSFTPGTPNSSWRWSANLSAPQWSSAQGTEGMHVTQWAGYLAFQIPLTISLVQVGIGCLPCRVKQRCLQQLKMHASFATRPGSPVGALYGALARMSESWLGLVTPPGQRVQACSSAVPGVVLRA